MMIKNALIKKVIIPVAGMGTRFLPATKAQPKEMLPLVDKPVIQYLVEEAVGSGISDVIFVTGRAKRAIEDHFDYCAELESTLLKKGKKEIFQEIRAISDMACFTYVRQKAPRGDGDALLCASHLVDNEPVAVLYGDDIVDAKIPCLLQMIKVFEKYRDTVIALDEVPREDVSRYGVVRAIKISDNVYEIKDIVEKPSADKAPSNMIVVGKYILTLEVFEELKKLKPVNGEIRLADALKNLLERRPIYGYRFEGARYDCGNKLGFLQATVEFALRHPEVKDGFWKYLKEKIKKI